MERNGVATVAIQLLREVAETVRPPRSLWVPFPHGYAMGSPGDPPLQRAIFEAALRLLEDPAAIPPVLREFTPRIPS